MLLSVLDLLCQSKANSLPEDSAIIMRENPNPESSAYCMDYYYLQQQNEEGTTTTMPTHNIPNIEQERCIESRSTNRLSNSRSNNLSRSDKFCYENESHPTSQASPSVMYAVDKRTCKKRQLVFSNPFQSQKKANFTREQTPETDACTTDRDGTSQDCEWLVHLREMNLSSNSQSHLNSCHTNNERVHDSSSLSRGNPFRITNRSGVGLRSNQSNKQAAAAAATTTGAACATCSNKNQSHSVIRIAGVQSADKKQIDDEKEEFVFQSTSVMSYRRSNHMNAFNHPQSNEESIFQKRDYNGLSRNASKAKTSQESEIQSTDGKKQQMLMVSPSGNCIAYRRPNGNQFGSTPAATVCVHEVENNSQQSSQSSLLIQMTPQAAYSGNYCQNYGKIKGMFNQIFRFSSHVNETVEQQVNSIANNAVIIAAASQYNNTSSTASPLKTPIKRESFYNSNNQLSRMESYRSDSSDPYGRCVSQDKASQYHHSSKTVEMNQTVSTQSNRGMFSAVDNYFKKQLDRRSSISRQYSAVSTVAAGVQSSRKSPSKSISAQKTVGMISLLHRKIK